MQSNLMSVPVTNRRRKLVTSIIVAGILSAVGVGSYVSWTASADERPAHPAALAAAGADSVNIDSLYQAKANETVSMDSAYTAPMTPERTISGRISWYGPGFHGRRTASGERFDKTMMTAAHKTLPFGTILRVVDEATGRSVLVRVNDRGPYCGHRVLDLSEAAAYQLGIKGRGTAEARLEIYAPPAMPHGVSRVTYDASGTAVIPHGYTVKVASVDNFDAALELQGKLHQDGYDDVFLTQVRRNNHVSYMLSVGLLSSERLCTSLLADVSDTYQNAGITTFARIAVADSTDTQLASTAAAPDSRDGM